MEFDIQPGGREFTDRPRDLTFAEVKELQALDLVRAIKRHRELTESTLKAAWHVCKCIHAGHHVFAGAQAIKP